MAMNARADDAREGCARSSRGPRRSGAAVGAVLVRALVQDDSGRCGDPESMQMMLALNRLGLSLSVNSTW
jgi:hypothetical protein